jgi:microcystin degradation protein MlrC
MERYRIGVGGIAIESSTFSPLPSTIDDFRILRGGELLERYPLMPGWSFRGRDDIVWLPCMHARAIPGGSVTAACYAALKAELLERVRAALPLDGFLLDIHGAMHVLGLDDAEADQDENAARSARPRLPEFGGDGPAWQRLGAAGCAGRPVYG